MSTNDPVNVTVNDPVNGRQKWFLEQLTGGERATSSDLAQRWNVSQVTAKRDIAELKDHEVIEFVGSPKTGRYRLK
jgi:predicted HTH transcriptional regulator